MAMASGSNITVCWGDGSPPCWNILSTLEEKQLHGYQSIKLSFEKGDNKSEKILALNPRGQLPTCTIDDVIINESLAMCLHLDEAYPDQGTALMPVDVKQRAIVWQRISEFYWNFPKRGYTDLVRHMWHTPVAELDPKRIAKAKEAFIAELEIWDSYLNKNNKYIAGDTFTLADIMAFPWIAFLVNVGLKLKPRFDNIAAYYDFMKERPSLKKHWPKNWDGTVETTSLSDLYENTT